ncbi:MAG: hypothetical protein EON96_00715 [Caulobacteraceae bacterium]|nr:MAG: hypothetical protein EON96_00715 [Caulobacteraceae bacterium]
MAKHEEVPAKRCFMITPIGAVGSDDRKRADWIYEFVLKEACKETGLKAERADLMAGSPMIGTRIFEALQNADVCVADLSALNANVFYEVGVRHTLQKPIIHIAEEGTSLPFDNAQHEAHFYDLTEVGSLQRLRSVLVTQLSAALAPGFAVSNPLTTALGTIAVSESGDSRDQIFSQLAERVDAIERDVRNRGGAFASSDPQRMKAADAIRNLIGELLTGDKSDTHFSARSFAELLDRGSSRLPPTDLEALADLLHRPTSFGNSEELLLELGRRYPSLGPRF